MNPPLQLMGLFRPKIVDGGQMKIQISLLLIKTSIIRKQMCGAA
nr:unnamed protein product [Callosobruchus analis]